MLKVIIPVITLFIIALIGFVLFLQPKQQAPAKIITIHPTITNTPTPTTSASISATIMPSIAKTASPTAGIIPNATQANIHTAKGDLTIKLYPQDAPKTVANFATLAQRGYYNNLKFHRVE